MKFADILNIAKNIPLSSFDWGQDATMFLNRRLPDGSLVETDDTGAQALTKLIALNPDKMMSILGMDVVINGNRLIITEPEAPEVPAPPPTTYVPPMADPVATIPTIPVTTPEGGVTVAIPVVPVAQPPGPKWPLFLACLLVVMLVAITVFATTDTTTEAHKGNKKVASSGLLVIAEIIRAISGHTDPADPYNTTTDPEPEPVVPQEQPPSGSDSLSTSPDTPSDGHN